MSHVYHSLHTVMSSTNGSRRPRVAVIGAGVSSLPTAVMLTQSKYFPQVTVISEEFTPNTTSDTAAASLRITQNKTGSTDQRKERWTRETYEYFFDLFASPLAGKLEMSLVTMYVVYEGHREDPWWKDLVLGFRSVSASEKIKMNISQDKNAWCYSTLIFPCGPYLTWQMEQFKANGGRVIQKKLRSLQEIDGIYDVIVNCSGLGSIELVNDRELYPVRGQAILVDAPWVKHSITAEVGEDVTYIYPRRKGVVLGGTAQLGNWSKDIDFADREGIMARCSKYVPSLAQAEVITEWVGLRPGRKQVRLEVEYSQDKAAVVHNYGHTGQGLVFSIGCAKDSIKHVEECFKQKAFQKCDDAKL